MQAHHTTGESHNRTLLMKSRSVAAPTFSSTVLLIIATAALALSQSAAAQETRAGLTRLLLTEVTVKPDRRDDWIALQRDDVVPALRKAGVGRYTVYETLIGDASQFVIVQPLPSFGEFDEPDRLTHALGAGAAAALQRKLAECTLALHRSIENSHDEFFLDPGAAAAVFVSRYRAMPGRARDYMSFVRTEMYPVMKRAQDDGTFAGLSVTTSVQGGEPGIITLNMFYESFAPLDGPPPIAKTLGPKGTAEFLAKGAGLITQLEQRVLKRLPDLSF